MTYAGRTYSSIPGTSSIVEKQNIIDKRRQSGISFPSPRKQDNLLIIRLDLKTITDKRAVKQGLKRLCMLFEDIDNETICVEDTMSEEEPRFYSLAEFNFTATIGFGMPFFRKLNVVKSCPKYFYDMPSASELGDNCGYVLPQTDMILQIASNNSSINKMVLQNDFFLKYHKNRKTDNHTYSPYLENKASDILEAINDWAKVKDVHYGFHRADGRNLMGFKDGISNPYRLDDNIWINKDEGGIANANGTFMVFQKIEHNIRKWQKLNLEEQENWVGRSKATGLLLGTLSTDQEKNLVSELYSTNEARRKQAQLRLSKFFDEQRDPRKKFFDPYNASNMEIFKSCPISSHTRKANPRLEDSNPGSFIFRRGCLYMEEEFADYPKSGILFISFQNDIKKFEDIKKRLAHKTDSSSKMDRGSQTGEYLTPNLPVKSSFDTLTLGGGYYFIPPIVEKKISEIGQHFF